MSVPLFGLYCMYFCIYPSLLSFFLSLPAHRPLCQSGAHPYGGHSNSCHREEIPKLLRLVPLSLFPFLIHLLFPGSTLHLCHTPKCHKTPPFTGGTFLATGQVVLGNLGLGGDREAAFLKTRLTQRDNRVIAVHTHTHT